MRKLLAAIQKAVKEAADRGEEVDLGSIAGLIEAAIPPLGARRRQFFLALADILVAAVASGTVDPSFWKPPT